MIESRGQVEIAKSPEEVFDFLADMRNEPMWLPGASDVRASSDGPISQGSEFEGTYVRAGTVHCVLSEYDRPRRLTIHGEAKGMAFDDVVTLAASENGTRLDAVMRTEPKGLFKLVAPMMRRVIDKQFQSNWEKLRSVLEA
jgi:carbon monoxide dehydrogenase subunit G